MQRSPSAIDLYWIPLGAGGWFVRLNGSVFEAVTAFVSRRSRCDLYHAALEVSVPGCCYVIEQTPVPKADGAARGVVCSGPVGARWAGRFRLFRYEIRRWPHGVIPDARYAVASPLRLTGDEATARRLLNAVPGVPPLVWGRDELHAGEMWNSNSVAAWLLESSGLNTEGIKPPPGGRAVGWRAGRVAARRAARVRAAARSPLG